MQTRVVILSHNRLFAEGVMSRLRQYLKDAHLEVADPGQLDVMARITSARPSIIIADLSDFETVQLWPFTALLFSTPALKIIGLDPEQEQIQVVTSCRRRAAAVRDLVDVIEPSVGRPPSGASDVERGNQ